MLWSKIKTKLVEKNMTEYELGKVTGLGAQQIHQFKKKFWKSSLANNGQNSGCTRHQLRWIQIERQIMHTQIINGREVLTVPTVIGYKHYDLEKEK